MSEVNISILSRILPIYLREHPEDAAQVQEILRAAHGVEPNNANEEQPAGQPQNTAGDEVLTDTEATSYVQQQQAQVEPLRQRLNVLTSRRDSLVGSLQSAESTLRSANASEEDLALIRRVAQLDNDAQNISLPELQSAIQELQAVVQSADHLNASEFFGQVEGLVRQCRALERTNPEMFLPETEEAQRAPINLDFLKYLEEGDWQQMEAIHAQMDRGERINERDVVTGFYASAITLLQLAQIDWRHRTPGWTDSSGHWSVPFQNVQTLLQAMPREAGEQAQIPELAMANFRYTADQLAQDMGRLQGERLTAHPERTNLGISFNPLLQGDPLVFQNFPVLDLYRNELGDDGILTMPELARSLRHNYAPHYERMPDPQEVMNELRVLVTAQLPGPVAPEAAAARSGDSYIRELNRLVLADLVRMREGFTERDRQLVTEMPVDNVMELGTEIVTFGGFTTNVLVNGRWSTGGPTYNDVQRGLSDMHDISRGRALESLRRLIEDPQHSSDFRAWLSHRHGAEAQVSIPNALAYLATYDPAAVAALNGPFFQATRLWNIRQMTDGNSQARAWLSLASDLRSGYRGDVASMIHRVPNLSFARAILASLRRESNDPGIRREARVAFQDSMGFDIEDDNGNVVTKGNGELGFVPWDWFRNYSDESAAAAPGEGVLIGASLLGGGAVFRVGRGLLTATGRRAILAGLGEFVGVRSTMLALGETTAGMGTVTSQGLFGRAMSSWVSRRVATAEARVLTATNAAETAAARQALARVRNIQQILTSPVQALADSGTAGSMLVGAGRILNFPLRGLRWVVNDGIFRYGIAQQLYNQYLRPRRPPLVFDREFRLDLSSPASQGGTNRRN